jgi:hypothetical protein
MLRAHGARHADVLEHEVRQGLAERAERRPLPADEGDERDAAGGVDHQSVVARDLSGAGRVARREGTDAAEAVHDLLAPDGDVGEHVADEVEEVVDLLLRAPGGLRGIGREIGRTDHHTSLQRIDQDDAPVGVLEEDLASSGRGDELGVVEHDVRALRTAHEARGLAECLVREVGPGAARVDDRIGLDGEDIAGLAVVQSDAGSGESRRLDIVERVR